MELSYNKEGVNLKGNEFNVNAKEFQPRQNAVTVANFKIKGQNDDENDKKWNITQIWTKDLIVYIEQSTKDLHILSIWQLPLWRSASYMF